MRTILVLLFCFTTALTAAEKQQVDPVLQGALAGLEKRLEFRFDKPFPDNWDIDVHSKQPIGLIAVNGGKVSATRPMVNPYDGQTIE